jgi:hypothetical protein
VDAARSTYVSVSDDGFIVGKSLINSSSGSERAFRWTTRRGMQDLQRELLDADVRCTASYRSAIRTTATIPLAN